jgi:hypothetical protein
VAAIWQPPLIDSSQRLHQVGHAALKGNVRFAAPFYTPCPCGAAYDRCLTGSSATHVPLSGADRDSHSRAALDQLHLLALVPRQRTSQLLRQFADVLGKRRNDRRRVLARKLDQYRKAAVALNQRGDVRIIPSSKKVAFPMAGHGTILGLGGPLADRDHIENVSLPTPGIVAFGEAHLTSGAQVRRQLLFQHAACLNEETAIDRFVRYLHVLVGRELPLRPARDLLR